MPKISQLTQYSQPQDNDVQPIVDTANSQTKKILWSSIKNALKSYFDTLYESFGAVLNHASQTSTHGVSGDIVGTSDNQKITNKNIVIPINEQTSSYTLVLSDAGKMIDMNVASANTITIPPNSSVPFDIGTQIIIRQKGAGQTTITAGSGVTINVASSLGLKLSEQYAVAGIIKVATDIWSAFGDIKA